MNKILIYWDTEGDTLTVWLDDPKLEQNCREIGDEIVLSKDALGRVIGFEMLTCQARNFPLSAVRPE